MKKERIAFFLLVLTTLIWGLSFLVAQDLFNSGWSPIMLVFVRSLLGLIVTIPFVFKTKWWENKRLIIDSVICGVAYFVGFTLQGYGQYYSTIDNAAFLTVLNIIFIPLIMTLFLKHKIAKKMYIAIIFATLGVVFLSFKGTVAPHIGDIYLIIGALGFALQIIFAEKAARQKQMFVTSAIQMFVMSVLGGLGLLFTQDFSIPTTSWGGILYLGLLATGLCGIFQMYAQRYISPSKTSIIYTFEAVIAAAGAVIFKYEPFSWQMVIGGVLMIIAVLITELNFNLNKSASL